MSKTKPRPQGKPAAAVKRGAAAHRKANPVADPLRRRHRPLGHARRRRTCWPSSRSYALIPVECRFHVERRGFPGLLAGEVTKEQFIKRLRGFWWKGFQTNRFRGLYRFVDRERLRRRGRALRRRLRRRPRGSLPSALLRPALAPGRGGGRIRDHRAELRRDRGGADPRPPLSRGALHPRRPRRARRLGLARTPDPRLDLSADAAPGTGVVGGPDPGDRRGRARDPR